MASIGPNSDAGKLDREAGAQRPLAAGGRDACPTCGCPVVVVSGREGTSYFVPANKRERYEAVLNDIFREVTSIRRKVDGNDDAVAQCSKVRSMICEAKRAEG